MFSTLLAISFSASGPVFAVVGGCGLTVVGLITVSWIGEQTLLQKVELHLSFLRFAVFA
jgi:hypothetical protein